MNLNVVAFFSLQWTGLDFTYSLQTFMSLYCNQYCTLTYTIPVSQGDLLKYTADRKLDTYSTELIMVKRRF